MLVVHLEKIYDLPRMTHDGKYRRGISWRAKVMEKTSDGLWCVLSIFEMSSKRKLKKEIKGWHNDTRFTKVFM